MTHRRITAAKVAVYRQYSGDIDGWTRSTSRSADLNDNDWYLIDDLRQRFFLVLTRNASQSFIDRLEADLALHVPDESARSGLRELAVEDVKAQRS
jgi:hypothetical protein